MTMDSNKGAPTFLESQKPVIRWFSNALVIAADTTNFFALYVSIRISMWLWEHYHVYVANAGGYPHFDIEYIKQIVAMPGLHWRVFWWTCAWACLVFATGFALLALMGCRWAFWRVQAYISYFSR